MTERSYPWDGIVTGDATTAPYNDDEWSDIWSCLLNYDRTVDGVVPNRREAYWGFLEVKQSLWGSSVTVEPGVAVVDGKVYINDSRLEFVTSGAGDYSVVLRKTFGSQTVRAALRSLGVTQTDGDIWEIKLADVNVSALGVITITDQRRFIHNGPSLQKRQGGDVSLWSSPGTTWYDVLDPGIQVGVGSLVFGAGSYSATTNIYFPRAFEEAPIMIATIISLSVWTDVSTNVYTITSSGGSGGGNYLTVTVYRANTVDGDVTVTFSWFAIGNMA